MVSVPLLTYFIGLMAVFCYAALSTLAKIGSLSVPPFAFITISNAFLFCFGLAGWKLFEKDFSLGALDKKVWIPLVIFAVVNFIGYVLYLYAINRMPLAHYSIIGLLTPIFVGLMAMIFLSEPFHMRYLVGLAFVSAGIFIAIQPKL